VARRAGQAGGARVGVVGGVPAVDAAVGAVAGEGASRDGKGPPPARRAAIDGTGLAPTDRGEHTRAMRRGRKHAGLIRVAVAADAGTGRILGASVTGDRVPGRQAMRQAVLAAVRSGLPLPGTGALADAASAGARPVRFLESPGLEPVALIPISRCRGGGPGGRRRLARAQLLGPGARRGESPCGVPAGKKGPRQRRWRRRMRFGEGWAAERAFAAIKRMFGPGMRPRTPAGIAGEVAPKLAIHNMLCVA